MSPFTTTPGPASWQRATGFTLAPIVTRMERQGLQEYQEATPRLSSWGKICLQQFSTFAAYICRLLSEHRVARLLAWDHSELARVNCGRAGTTGRGSGSRQTVMNKYDGRVCLLGGERARAAIFF